MFIGGIVFLPQYSYGVKQWVGQINVHITVVTMLEEEDKSRGDILSTAVL